MNAIEVAHVLRSLGHACKVSNDYHRPQCVTLLRRPLVVRECDGPGFDRWFRIESDDGETVTGAVRTEDGLTDMVLRLTKTSTRERLARGGFVPSQRARRLWATHRAELSGMGAA